MVKKSELSQSSGPGFHSCHRSEVVKTLAYIRVVQALELLKHWSKSESEVVKC